MHLSRIPGERLTTKRLDADFYRPEYLSIESKLMSLRPCSLGQSGRFFAGPFGSKLPSNLYLDQGVPLFRVGNVGQFEALTDNLAHLNESVHEELRVSEVVPGDLLIVKASVGEKICKVPAWMSRANITQHIIAIRPNGRFDVDYLSAFLFGCYGRKQLQRYSLGSIIQYLGINDARSVLIPNIGPLAQEYIGNKVRQAERLRAWAKRRNLETKNFETLIPAKPSFSEQKHYTRVTHSRLTSNRLDSKYYRAHHLDLESQFGREFEAFSGIVDSFKYGASTESDYVTTGGIMFVRGNALLQNGIDASQIVFLSERNAADVAGNRLEIGDIIVTRSGTVGVTSYVDESYEGAAFGSFIIRCRLKGDAYRPEYISWYLNSWVGQQQFRRLENGAVQLNINLEELKSIKVWRASPKQQDNLAGLIIDSRLAGSVASKLTDVAKALVEALIEGQISETQLIEAQQALEAGDDSLDRAILTRLKTDGLEGTGEPLFPDLDQLYDLLERAQREAEA